MTEVVYGPSIFCPSNGWPYVINSVNIYRHLPPPRSNLSNTLLFHRLYNPLLPVLSVDRFRVSTTATHWTWSTWPSLLRTCPPIFSSRLSNGLAPIPTNPGYLIFHNSHAHRPDLKLCRNVILSNFRIDEVGDGYGWTKNEQKIFMAVV